MASGLSLIGLISEKKGEEKMIKNKGKEKEQEKKALDYEFCPKHSLRYPKGSVCPKCEEENRRRRN
jgi:hypothetical protein